MFKYIISKLLKKYFDHKKLSLAYTHIIKSRPYYKGIKKITDIEYKAFSQNGEDGIIDYLLFTLGIEKPKFVEIGVGDYSECNTRLLYHRTASEGLIIDCLNNFEKEVKKNVKIWKGGLNIVESFINDKNILSILSEKGFIKNIDLFSLDIDGIDYWVLEKLPNNFSKIAILEYNAIFGPELEVTVPNIERFNRTKYHYSNLCFGLSLRALINLMVKKDFIFVGTNLSSCNAFFVSRDQIHKMNLIIPDNINLNSHTNSFIRESRTKKGLLSYLSGKNRIEAIKDCEVINLKDDCKKISKLKNLI